MAKMILAPLSIMSSMTRVALSSSGTFSAVRTLRSGKRLGHRLAALVGGLVVAVVVLRADEDEADRLARRCPGAVGGGAARCAAVVGAGRSLLPQRRGQQGRAREQATLRSTSTHDVAFAGRAGVCVRRRPVCCAVCCLVGGGASSTGQRSDASKTFFSSSGASSAPALRPSTTSTTMREHVGDGVEGELVDRRSPGPAAPATGRGRRRTGRRRPATLNGWRAAKITTATAMKPRPCGHVLEPGVGVGDRQLGAADAGEHAADDHGDVLDRAARRWP